MTDLYNVAPGTTSYTTTSYLPGSSGTTYAGTGTTGATYTTAGNTYGTSYGGGTSLYGAGTSGYGGSTITYGVGGTSGSALGAQPTTRVVGQTVEANFGTNTADGFFGGGQAAVSTATPVTTTTTYVSGQNSSSYFGGQGAGFVSTVQPVGATTTTTVVETVKTAPPVTTTYTTTTPAPAPAPTFNAYQDYNAGLYDYGEAPKPASCCNIRNILLGCLGLLLLAGLLSGLLFLLRFLRLRAGSGVAAITPGGSIPSGLIPQVVPQPVRPVIPAPIVAPANATITITKPVLPATPVLIPVKPAPVVLPVVPIVTPAANASSTVVIQPAPVQPAIITIKPAPVQPAMTTIVTPTISGQTTTTVVQPQFVSKFSQEQLTAALSAAIAAGALKNPTQFLQVVQQAFRKYYTSDAEFAKAIQLAFASIKLPAAAPAQPAATNVVTQPAGITTVISKPAATTVITQPAATTFINQPAATTVVTQQAAAQPAALTANDVQTLLLLTNKLGGINSAILTQLKLTPTQYLLLLRNALSSGLINQAQFIQLTTGPAATPASIAATSGQIGSIAAPAAAQAAALPTLSASDIQQLLAFASAKGEITTDALSKLGLTGSQYTQMLKTALDSKLIDAGQFAKLSLASAGAGFLGALTNAAGSVGNVMSDAFSKVVSKASEGLSSAENMLETISNTSFTTPQGGQFRQLEADNRLF